MCRRIRARIARVVVVVSLAAIATAVVVAEAVAKPTPHASSVHLLPGGTLPAGWVFPVIISALAVATLLAALYAPYLRAVLMKHRRRRAISRIRVAGVSSGNGGPMSQAARRPVA